MKFAMAEKFHEKYLEDVMTEVSQDSLWSERLLAGEYNELFLLTYKELEELPCNLWTIFSKYGLEFLVSKVESCPEELALVPGSFILKFEAKEFKNVVSYSGNPQKEG